MYHQVTPNPLPGFQKYAVSPRSFARQMGWLAGAGYTVVGLDALLAHRRGGPRLPRRPVVITFDDGFRDCLEHAVPTLRERNFTALFFLVAGLMGKTSRWLKSERGIELPLMTWPEARRLQETGFQCGAHSLSHPRLVALTDRECRAELSGARARLEEGLGCAVRHVAYPFGSFDERVRAMTEEAGYETGCTVAAGVARPADDLFSLRRVPISGRDSLTDFAFRLRTGHPFQRVLRGTMKGAWKRVRRLGPGLSA